MPVDLKQIPKAEPLPVPPDKFRWLLVIALLMITGGVVVLSLWPKGVSTHSAWFWFCTVIAPLGAGLTVYIVRLRHYENERDRVLWWNHLHQKQHDEQILLGQQAVGVLAMSYTTPVASNKLAAALLQGANALQTHYSPGLQPVLTAASLTPLVQTLIDSEYQSRLEAVLTGVIGQLSAELQHFNGNLAVRLQHDGTLKNEQIIALWERIFPASDAVSGVSVSSENDGLMWIDEWLDQQDDTLLLSVEINLFMQPRDRQAESVSALMLASPAWLARQKLHPQMWIHRPVVVKDAEGAVADAVTWGKIASEQPWYFWRSQVNSDALAAVLQAMDTSGYLSSKKGEWVMDDSFGRPAAALGNITLICACEHAVASGLAQWLLVGEQIPQLTVVRPA